MNSQSTVCALFHSRRRSAAGVGGVVFSVNSLQVTNATPGSGDNCPVFWGTLNDGIGHLLSAKRHIRAV